MVRLLEKLKRWFVGLGKAVKSSPVEPEYTWSAQDLEALIIKYPYKAVNELITWGHLTKDAESELGDIWPKSPPFLDKETHRRFSHAMFDNRTKVIQSLVKRRYITIASVVDVNVEKAEAMNKEGEHG